MDHGEIDLSCPVNWDHPTNFGRVAWWLTVPEPGWWGGSTWRDLCGASGRSPHNGTLAGMTLPSATFGWRGPGQRPGARGAVAFDGAAGYVDAGSSPTLDISGSVTMGAWVRCDTFSNAYRLVMAKGTAGRNYAFGVDSAALNRGLYLQFSGVSGYSNEITLPVANTMSVGVWYHYAIVYDHDAQTLTVYQNGRQTNQATGLTGSLATNASPLIMGRGVDGWGYMNGAMDGLSVTSRAIPAAEVWAVFDQSRRGQPDTLNWLPSPALAIYPTPGGGAPPAKVPPHVFQSYPVGAF